MNRIAVTDTDPVSEPVTIEPGEVDRQDGREAIMARIKMRRTWLNIRMQPPYSAEQRQAAKDEFESITRTYAMIRELHVAAAHEKDMDYRKAFMFAAKAMLPAETMDALHAAARFTVEELSARRATFATQVGAALSPRGTGGTMRQRRTNP